MPQSRRESLIYTVLMCALMVFVMSVYNIARMEGLSWMAIKSAWLGLPLAFVVAMIGDWFLVSRPAKKLAHKMVGAKKQNLMVAIPCCMVCGMVIFMSLFGAVQNCGLNATALSSWYHNIFWNFVVALPLQLIIAGPIVRRVFRKLCPLEVTTG